MHIGYQQIYSIVKHSGSPVITTTGITVEAKTRRFVVDEQRELRYRAEIQNRVYKRELIEVIQHTKLRKIFNSLYIGIHM